MLWNELQEKSKVKLLVDLSVIDSNKVQPYKYYTPAELEAMVTVAKPAGTVYTIYPQDNIIELFDEATDDTLDFDPHTAIPCWIEVL